MTTTYLNSAASLFGADQLINEEEDQHHHHHHNHHHHHHQLLSPNLQASSSSSLSSHMFFNSSNPQDQGGYYRGHEKQPQEADNFASHGRSYSIENASDNRLKFSIWKEEDRNGNQAENSSPVKWMSSKMRVMLKMKNVDRTSAHSPTSTITTTTVKIEDHQKQASFPVETDNSSNSSSNNNNSPIRVCSDCNTTKTPLWRSGPRGPKSLCNACGIRQRKARRAMAAAAAEGNGTIPPTEASPMKSIKVKQHKNKRSSNGDHVTKHKKRCKLAATPIPQGGDQKLCFEDFLISLSKNLAFHRVFPQEEKEAAILLMALSCGHVHD